MYSTLTLKPGDSIGYHTHVGEQEIMLIKAVKEKMGSINFKLNVLIAFVVVMHAADLIMLLRLIA